MATDCNKHRAKTDKRKQRSVFREVLKAVEVSWTFIKRKHPDANSVCVAEGFLFSRQEGDFQSETIRFGTERMVIDSWVRKRTYDAFREFVGSGMNYHLQVFNSFLCYLGESIFKTCF